MCGGGNKAGRTNESDVARRLQAKSELASGIGAQLLRVWTGRRVDKCPGIRDAPSFRVRDGEGDDGILLLRDKRGGEK